ncbi:amidohydrolase family protein [Desulfovibrio sp.]|uniref:amidohydrolase family protein n=1 Tax=Desulfovibrio sp. TaxID=885 RepID=UPI00262FEE68|nr:amidohydrolase family protein [Desulfovibrio sp.]
MAWRARSLISLAGEGPARGRGLFAPLARVDDAFLLTRGGRIEAAGPWKGARLPVGTVTRDLGDACLMPACVNAHTHLQLSWLAGRTRWGHGFAAWLASLIPQIIAPLQAGEAEQRRDAITAACAALARSGTHWLGDVGGSAPGALTAVRDACAAVGLQVRQFCEWFGFSPPLVDEERPWPPRCREEIAADAEMAVGCAPGGHALYSTGPDILQAAREWCARAGRVFSFHLAESPEETELLTRGAGPLRECYGGTVLPPSWRPPGLRPLAHAMSLGLLGPGALAVHGVQLNGEEIAALAKSGAALCLCPRSNHNLGVGVAPARQLLESGALLCLGTDGLTSNTDLDVRNEALWLRERLDLPPRALVRLLTVNGAAALGFPPGTGTLAPGQPAAFAVLPWGLEEEGAASPHEAVYNRGRTPYAGAASRTAKEESMATVTAKYLGDLRTECVHVASGTTLVTDAPVDNQGNGESFSPTDLCATALATCAMTIIGIYGRSHGVDVNGATIEVTKTMSANPRRIAKIEMIFHMPDRDYTDHQKMMIQRAALTCPVHLSLHPDVEQVFTFKWAR